MQEVSVLGGHVDTPTGRAISPNGSYLLSPSFSSQTIIHDIGPLAPSSNRMHCVLSEKKSDGSSPRPILQSVRLEFTPHAASHATRLFLLKSVDYPPHPRAPPSVASSPLIPASPWPPSPLLPPLQPLTLFRWSPKPLLPRRKQLPANVLMHFTQSSVMSP